ncbi:MAG: hypothetical protein NTAFB05_19810 [Nitrobacter sp.]|uniref:hypothetical protein n=1 Tax=Nitrobacter sp. TaxID=29420 RepID=UPI00387DEF9D
MRRVYVISDLHLAGEYPKQPGVGRGFRHCTRADAIVDFIGAVVARTDHSISKRTRNNECP